jgi:hypothetical protein
MMTTAKLKSFAVFLLAATVATARGDQPTNTPASDAMADKAPSKRELGGIRTAVETLRGKRFLHDVPAYDVSKKELRAIMEEEVAKEYPGMELTNYQNLLIWLDAVPPGTDLRKAYADYAVDQVAGLYDSDKKEMCIPKDTTTNAPARKAAEKKLAEFDDLGDRIVFSHEYTHALEDQYWPMDDPEEKSRKESTDRETARNFLYEGSATRLMVEAIPTESKGSAQNYIFLWNVIHANLTESILDSLLLHVWRSDDAKVKGVAESLTRSETMSYSYGYPFCSAIMRQWGLDGLDYVFDHPPVSTEQMMHPDKYWVWRDFPVKIVNPETPASGWKQVSGDSMGEAGVAVLFGCQFKSLGKGLRIAEGWDGDRATLYEGPDGHYALLWTSSWDCSWAASSFASACAKEREKIQKAKVTKESSQCRRWTRPDGRSGAVWRDGKRVYLLETDDANLMAKFPAWRGAVTFTEPPQDAERAAANQFVNMVNPVFSQQVDGDYLVSRALWGLLLRSDHNSVGTANRVVLGFLAKTSHTATFTKWSVGTKAVMYHDSDERRGISRTSILPWGVLAYQFESVWPQNPTKSMSHFTMLWGFLARHDTDGPERTTTKLLPWGLLYKNTKAPGRSSFHILATGVSKSDPTTMAKGRTKYHFLGLPVWWSTTPKLEKEPKKTDSGK